MSNNMFKKHCLFIATNYYSLVTHSNNLLQTSSYYNYEENITAIGTVLQYLDKVALLECLVNCQTLPDCSSINIVNGYLMSSSALRLFDVVSCELLATYILQMVKTTSTLYISKVKVCIIIDIISSSIRRKLCLYNFNI